MGIVNRDGALYSATGIDNTGLYSGRREALGIIKAMAGEITSFDVFGGIGVSAALAFAQAAKEAYNFEKQFQQSMKEVATLSSGIKGSLTDYMNQVIDLTREIPVLANDSAKALYQIVSAGHDGAAGMKVLEVSAKAAVGGVTDTATAADGVTTLLNAYKLDVSQAEKISDQLFTTVKLGKTSFGELSKSIAQAAPIAASYGVEVDQVLAAVATLTKQGTPTAQAMTQIRASIIAVSKVLGDGAFDTRTYQEALAEIARQAGGSEAKLRELVPEIEAVNAVLGLTGINVQEAAGHLGEMQNATGAAEAAFKEMASSAENQLKLLGNNVSAALRPLGQGILKEISAAAQSMNEAFGDGSAQEALKNIGGLIVVVTTALAGYKGSIIAVSAAKQIQAAVTTILNKQRVIEAANLVLSKGMYAAEAAVVARNTSARLLLTKAIKAQTIAQLKNAAAMLTNPYVLAAAAFAALGYAIYKCATAETVAEKATRMHNAALEAQKRQLDELKSKTEEYLEIIRSEVSTRYDKEKALDSLQKMMPTIFKNMDIEKLKLMDELSLRKQIAEEINRRERIGAQTNLIMATNKYNTATAEHKRKTDMGLAATNALSDKNDAFLEMELAQKQYDKILNIQKKAEESLKPKELKIVSLQSNIDTLKAEIAEMQLLVDKEKEETGGWSPTSAMLDAKKGQLSSKEKEMAKLSPNKTGKSETKAQNKAYWEDLKKNAQTQLDALTDIEAAGKQGTKLKDKIAEYDKKINAFSANTSKQENKADTLRQDQEKYNLLLNKQALDQSRSDEDLQTQVDQARINAMDEGSEKTIAQMNLDHQKEIETLKRNREDYLQKKIEAEKAIFEADPSNKGKSFDSSTVSLSKDEKGMFKNLLESTISQQGNELAAYYEEALSKYQGYAEKRLAAQKKFQQERDVLVKAGASKESLDENDYQRDETLKAIDNEFSMREDSFKAWADNIADLSLEKLRVLLVQAERELERSEFLNPKDPKLAGQRAKVTSLKNTISEKSEETNILPDKRNQKEWQDLYKTLSKVETEFEEIGDTVGGTAGEIISAAGAITTSTLKMIDGIVSLSDSSAWAISSTATAAEKAIKAVEKASVILAIIGAAMKIASEISQMITGESQEEKMKRTVDYYNKIVDIYDQIIDKQKESIKFGYGFSSIQAATKAMDELNKRTEYNRKIADVSGKAGISFKDYGKDYDRLADELGLSKVGMINGFDAAIDTSELSRLTGKQLEYIRDNYKELWAGLRDEQRDALQAIIDAEEKSKEIVDGWKESITGISYDSFYTEFIDTLSDMDSSAEDMANNFGEYLKKSILAAMVAKEFQGEIDNLYEMWAAAGKEESDGGIDITKQEAEDLQKRQKELTEAMIKRREEMEKTYGWESSESSSQDSTQKGFAAMSQDTGNELNGRFTALQISNEEIKNQLIFQTGIQGDMLRRLDEIYKFNAETSSERSDMMLSVIDYLEGIYKNTNSLPRMEKILEDIKISSAALAGK